MKVTIVTGNAYKFEVLQKLFSEYGIECEQVKLDLPEIQSMDVQEVCSYKAKLAAEQAGKPVLVEDAGWYFEALNGFPGPFIKFINKWFTADDFINLMQGKEDRTILVKSCAAFCEPGKEPITFFSISKGTAAFEKGAPEEARTPVNQIFIPEGKTKVASEIPHEEMVDFWAKNVDGLTAFARFFRDQSFSN